MTDIDLLQRVGKYAIKHLLNEGDCLFCIVDIPNDWEHETTCPLFGKSMQDLREAVNER